MKSGYSVELDNFAGSGCLRKCELLPTICLLFVFTFVITFFFPFFQFLLFYRSDFIFLKIQFFSSEARLPSLNHHSQNKI